MVKWGQILVFSNNKKNDLAGSQDKFKENVHLMYVRATLSQLVDSARTDS